MPSGAKKRKALKKKKEQEAFGATASNKGFNGHGYDEHGSQDEGESDGNLSSPGSQGNGELWTRDLSPSPLSGLGKDTVKEKTEDADVPQGHEAKGEDFIALGRGSGHEENGVDKQPNSFSENVTHSTGKPACQEAGGALEITPADDDSVKPVDSSIKPMDSSVSPASKEALEIAPAVDSVKPVDSSVSEVVITSKNEQAESSTDSDSVQQKADESEEKRRQEEAKEGNIPESAAETSKEVKSVKESEVPECSEEKEENIQQKVDITSSKNSRKTGYMVQFGVGNGWNSSDCYGRGNSHVRDDMETIGKMVKSTKWKLKMRQSKDNEGLLSIQKSWWWRPTETETIKSAIA